MKNHVCLAIIVAVCACCSTAPRDDANQRTLYITSSEGAFMGDNVEAILPLNAYVTMNYLSSNVISMNVYYSWGESNSLSIEIPSIIIEGSFQDFSFSQAGVAARSSMSLPKTSNEDITVDIDGFYKDGSFNLALLPSNTIICPKIEIKEVSQTPVELTMGGADVELYGARILLNNQLNVPVFLHWDYVTKREIEKIEIGESKSYNDIYHVFGDPFALKPVLTINDKKYEVDFFVEGRYTEERIVEYHFYEGEPGILSFTLYSVNIDQNFYSTLMGENN